MSRYARKIDNSQHEVIEELRRLGCSVTAIQSTKAGCPDLLVGLNGHTFLIEVKTGKNTLRIEQLSWVQAWKGSRVAVVNNAESASKWVSAVNEDETDGTQKKSGKHT